MGTTQTAVIVFDSNGWSTRDGFEANFTCIVPPVMCDTFTCPTGSAAIEGAANTPGADEATCCRPLQPCTTGFDYTDSASIDSHDVEYDNNDICQWSMSCSDASQVPQLSFSSFQTESNFDFVYLFDGECALSDFSSPVRGDGLCGSTPYYERLTGTAAQSGATPDQLYNFTTQTAVMILFSDVSGTRDGFDA